MWEKKGLFSKWKERNRKGGKEWRRKRVKQMEAGCDGSYLTVKGTKSQQMNWISLWTNASTHTPSWKKQSERARIQMRAKWQHSAGGRGEARTECILSRVRRRREQHEAGCTGPGRRREKRGWIWWKEASGLLIHLPAEQQRLATLKLGLIVRVHVCPGGGRNSKVFGLKKKQTQHRHLKNISLNRFLIRIQGNTQIFQLFFVSRLKRLNINDADAELVCHSGLGGINCKTSLNMQYLCISF